MKKLMMTLALGAAMVSTPALAQDGGRGGGFMRDQTRAEAQQRADTMFQMLDSNKDLLGPEQWNQELKWIEAELSRPRKTWMIACAHHPLFSNGDHGDIGVLQNTWGELFQKHKLDFYLCGHDHDVQHAARDRHGARRDAWFESGEVGAKRGRPDAVADVCRFDPAAAARVCSG